MTSTHSNDDLPIVTLRGGASMVTCKPLFSPDSKYLFCGCGDLVKVLSISSGECIRKLQGHTAKVTGIVLHPANQFHLLSCSLDHSVIKWDHQDGTLLKRFEFGCSLHSLYSTCLTSTTLLTIKQISHTRYNLESFVLPKSDTHMVSTKTVIPAVTKNHNYSSIGCNSEYACSIQDTSLSLYFFKKKLKKERQSPDGSAFRCVACHPQEMSIATGCENGRIIIWWDLLSNKDTHTVYHWHSLPVRCITFTTEGSYYLSGGHECVLLKWQYNSKHKDTLPRLGAPIINVTCSKDNRYYATCHADNSIQVITSNFTITQIYSGLTRGHVDQQVALPLPVGPMIDPQTKALVLNGRPGHLQFFSLQEDKQLFTLDIVCQNYISPDSLKRPKVCTEVEKAAFSNDGLWLATFERRDDGFTTPEMRLKFWMYDKKKQSFTLNTEVDQPHKNKVEVLKFRPSTENIEPMAVTTSFDGKFKLWQLHDDTDIYKESSCWLCESVGFYRDCAAGVADFSEDGSLLAVVFDSNITLWNPDTNALQATLPTSHEPAKEIRNLIFGVGQCCHLLTCVTNQKLLVYNLLTCSVQWSLSLDISAITQDSVSSYIAAFTSPNETKQSSLMLFSPASSEVVYEQSHICGNKVMSAIFVPRSEPRSDYDNDSLSWQRRSQLYFITEDQELLTLMMKSDTTNEDSERKLVENLPQTAFSRLLAEKTSRPSLQADMKDSTTLHGKPGAKFLQEMLNTPANVLPPTSAVCMSFLDTLMKKSQTNNSSSDDEDDEEFMAKKGQRKVQNEDSDESDMDVDIEPSGSATGVTQTPSTGVTQKTNDDILSRTEQFEKLSLKSFRWLHSDVDL